MEAHKNNIKQFLTATDRCFMIPVYQRNYDWKEDNCAQLWRDIWDVSQEPMKIHFLGTICSKAMNGYEKTIIDGQQRITTVTLLIKAIHDYVDNEDFKRDLDSNFIHNNGYGVTVDHKVKLHLNKRDDAIYNKLLQSKTLASPDNFTSEEQESRIYQNYKYFCECVKDLSEVQIAGVKNALDRIVFVDLDVENEDPQEIFESLNSTGLDLTKVDLIRNYLLMSLDRATQERLYDEYWFKIEENVRPDNMVRFFTDYLIYTNKSDAVFVHKRRAHINENYLYIAFRDYYEKVSKKLGEDSSNVVTEYILKDMCQRSAAYRYLVFKDNIDMNNLDEMNRIIYSIVNINQAVTSRPVLLYVMENYLSKNFTYDEALEMFKACLSMVFRCKVVSNTGISGQFAGNMLLRISNDSSNNNLEAFWTALTSGKERFSFPTDIEFKKGLVNRKIFEILRANGTKYLLYTLEQNSASSKGLPRYDDTTITVEHIMPKTPDDEWIKYLGEDASMFDDYLNKLGNLALTNYNSEMANRSFDKKKDWYKDANFSYTRSLVEYDKWGIDKIRARGLMIAELCAKIWTMPAKYQPAVTIDDYSESEMKRRGSFKFSMIGLSVGDEITFISDPSKTATVINDTQVEYCGTKYSLSMLAAHLLGRSKSDGISGPLYFTHNGETLDELRNDWESNMHVE